MVVQAQSMNSVRIEVQRSLIMNEPTMRRPIGTPEVPRSTGNLLDHLILGLPTLQVLRTEAGRMDHLIRILLPPRGRRPVTMPAKAQLAHLEVAPRDDARDNENRTSVTVVHRIQLEAKAVGRMVSPTAEAHHPKLLATKVALTSRPSSNGSEMWRSGSFGVNHTCPQKSRPSLCSWR